MITVPAFVVCVAVERPPADEAIGGEVAGKGLGDGIVKPGKAKEQRCKDAREERSGEAGHQNVWFRQKLLKNSYVKLN